MTVRAPAPLAARLPAGPCGFDPYLEDACTEAPRFAVVTMRTSDPRAAERALRAMPAGDGYPFAESFDVIPAADPRVRGIGVFAGLFRDRGDAEARAAQIGGELVPLASLEEQRRRFAMSLKDGEARERAVVRVVETTAETPAWAAEDLARVEQDLDEALGVKWTGLEGQQTRRAAALAALAPRCTVAVERVFVTNAEALYRFRRTYAPVVCDDGRPAWIPWRATRLESAVVDGRVHQVVLVECDVPTLETRELGARPKDLGPLTLARCD